VAGIENPNTTAMIIIRFLVTGTCHLLLSTGSLIRSRLPLVVGLSMIAVATSAHSQTSSYFSKRLAANQAESDAKRDKLRDQPGIPIAELGLTPQAESDTGSSKDGSPPSTNTQKAKEGAHLTQKDVPAFIAKVYRQKDQDPAKFLLGSKAILIQVLGLDGTPEAHYIFGVSADYNAAALCCGTLLRHCQR
jgi:hypothetical protein